ncbi:MAG TPA: hypothetical protein VMU33_12405 [Burkholderiaceae bacterium]|nr:hypothetical protein [Burkholderiaceae bacterium]
MALRITRLAAWLLLATCASGGRAADPIIRCESGDGHVTYSNGACPAGTRQQRTIDAAPALEVTQPRGAAGGPGAAAAAAGDDGQGDAAGTAKDRGSRGRELPLRPDGAKPEASKGEAKGEVPKASPTRAAAAAKPSGGADGDAVIGKPIRSAKASPAVTPEQAKEAEADRRKAQLGACDDLVRQIEYAQHDVEAASADEHASAELALRRLQAEHTEKCLPPAKKGDAARKAPAS